MQPLPFLPRRKWLVLNHTPDVEAPLGVRVGAAENSHSRCNYSVNTFYSIKPTLQL